MYMDIHFLTGEEKFYQEDMLYFEMFSLWRFDSSQSQFFLLPEVTLELPNSMILKLQLYRKIYFTVLVRKADSWAYFHKI